MSDMQMVPRWQVHYAGVIIVFALVLGGGTAQGLWTDHLLQLIMVPAMLIGFWFVPQSRLPVSVLLMVAAIIALLLVQFLPISRTWPNGEVEVSHTSLLWTLSAQRTLEATLFVIPLIGFMLFVSRMPPNQQQNLVRFMMVGLIINLIIGAIQLSYSRVSALPSPLPYELLSASFANENHQSSLFFLMIPLLAFHYLVRVQKPLIFGIIMAVLLIYLFAIGSRAGTAISTLIAIWSFTLFTLRPSPLVAGGVIAIGVTAAVGLFIWLDVISELDSRLGFAQTTWTAFKDNWLFGTGPGSYLMVYAAYERVEDMGRLVANQAHNDWLQIALETGIAGIALLLVFSLLVVRAFFYSALSQAAALSAFSVMIHSLVDYPLRTMAIATCFAVLCAMMFCVQKPSRQNLQ